MSAKIFSVPTLAELPAPPPGLTGWPWTEASSPLPKSPPGGGDWPRISMITPSYNQGRYIEETIRSVLLQGYPNLEYHLIDGGSTDESVEIIRKYEPWLSGWVSEKDAGQSDAINKGFARCSGEVFNWICSDDVLSKGALETVGAKFSGSSECDVLAGACFCQYDDEPAKSKVRQAPGVKWENTPYAEGIWQPSCFWRKSLVKRKDLVVRDLHFCMDRELWCYLLDGGGKWCWTDKVLSVYRFTGDNKSVVGKRKIIDEVDRIYKLYIKEAIPLPALLRAFWLPYVLKSKRHGNPLVRVLSNAVSKGVAGILLSLYPKDRVRTLQHEFYVYSVW
jgi:glycosyltransferase involved in cell wall biosynthesis